MATKPWSERIPAAVAKGKAMSFDRWGCFVQGDICLTAGEAELAEALWKMVQARAVEANYATIDHPALITYTKKIERIESHA